MPGARRAPAPRPLVSAPPGGVRGRVPSVARAGRAGGGAEGRTAAVAARIRGALREGQRKLLASKAKLALAAAALRARVGAAK